MGLISLPYVTEVCKIGQGKACCRYLTVGAEGWDCVKLNTDPVRSLLDMMDGTIATMTAKQILDQRVANNEMTAQGDNCEGK